MTIPFVQFAFTGGELSQKFLHRSDVEKFSLGLRRAENWIVDYQGGVRTRPPLEFMAFTGTDTIRLMPFEFNAQTGNTYILVWDDFRLRFFQDGNFLTSADVPVTSYAEVSPGGPTIFTATAHGLSTGDEVYIDWNDDQDLEYLAGYEFSVTVADADTFVLDPLNSPGENLAIGSGSNIPNVKKIYEISTPYAEAILRGLDFNQYRDEVRITSLFHPPYKLVREAATSWTLTPIAFEGNRVAPDAPTVNISNTAAGTANASEPWTGPTTGTPYNPDAATADAAVIYAVTSIDSDGIESYVKAMTLTRTIIDITNNAGSLRIVWAPVDSAQRYRVYRSVIVPRGHEATIGMQLGYLGETIGTDFVDNNIVPDFTLSPLTPDNPFANGAVLGFDITSPGAGYTDDATISIADGTGFVGLPIINSEQELVGVRILANGEGYSDSSVVTITDASATAAATLTVSTSPASGNNPRTVTRYEQRNIYAGTINLPMSLFFERVGSPDNFDFSGLGLATDALDLELDSPQLTPIHSLAGLPLGLIAFTNKEIFQIYGTDNTLITASSARPTILSEGGAAPLSPIKLENRLIYATAGYFGIKAVEPTNLRNSYQTVDVSVFSEHLFSRDNRIVAWAYADAPQHQIWAVLLDGSALCMTYVPEQNVYAWTPQTTRGKFKDVVVIKEGGVDRVYFTVEREILGTTYTYIERLDLDLNDRGEEVWAMDSFRRYKKAITYSNDVVKTATSPDKTATITVRSLAGHSVAIGDYVRFGGGLMRVTEITSPAPNLVAQVDVLAEPAKTRFQSEVVTQEYTSYEWNSPGNISVGHYHLRAMAVESVSEMTQLPETASFDPKEISVPAGAAKPYHGLGYSGDLVTLPLSLSGEIIQHLKKRATDISLKTIETQGLTAGTISSGEFYELINSPYRDFELPEYVLADTNEIHLAADWREDDALVLRKSAPFRATVLGFVLNSEISND